MKLCQNKYTYRHGTIISFQNRLRIMSAPSEGQGIESHVSVKTDAHRSLQLIVKALNHTLYILFDLNFLNNAISSTRLAGEAGRACRNAMNDSKLNLNAINN